MRKQKNVQNAVEQTPKSSEAQLAIEAVAEVEKSTPPVLDSKVEAHPSPPTPTQPQPQLTEEDIKQASQQQPVVFAVLNKVIEQQNQLSSALNKVVETQNQLIERLNTPPQPTQPANLIQGILKDPIIGPLIPQILEGVSKWIMGGTQTSAAETGIPESIIKEVTEAAKAKYQKSLEIAEKISAVMAAGGEIYIRQKGGAEPPP